MSGFPWGWLLISAGASLVYSDKVTKWFERKQNEAKMLAVLVGKRGCHQVTRKTWLIWDPTAPLCSVRWRPSRVNTKTLR
jgi:hypothetical protein